MLKTNIKGLRNRIIRFGSDFKNKLSELNKNQYFSSCQIEAYRNEKLKSIVEHAYKNVPYYKEVFSKLKLVPDDINTTNDLWKLPIMSKDDVIKNSHKLISTNVGKLFVHHGYTSGTTGSPCKFLRDLPSINFENAAIWRQWQLSGYKLGEKRITIRGELIKETNDLKPPFWAYNFFENELLMSSYHMSNKTIPYYVEKLIDFQPEIVYAYPSSVYLLAYYMIEKNIKYKLKGVFTSSETVLDYQKNTIEKAFDCTLFDWYGMAERVAAIGTCEYGRYHEISDYSIVEYNQVTEKEYEVIGTTLHNYVMPLLRYNTKDIVIHNADDYCPCGRCFKTIDSIQGRRDDYIKLEDGRLIGRIDHIFKGVDGIKEAQVIQDSFSHITIKLSLSLDRHQFNEIILMNKINDRLGSTIKVDFDYVQKIDRTKSGKFKNIISLV